MTTTWCASAQRCRRDLVFTILTARVPWRRLRPVEATARGAVRKMDPQAQQLEFGYHGWQPEISALPDDQVVALFKPAIG